MDISLKEHKEVDYACDALVLPFVEGEADTYKDIHPSLSEQIGRVFGREFQGKKNECLLIPSPKGMRPERILLVGLGKREFLSAETLRQSGGKAAAALRDAVMKTIALSSKMSLPSPLSPADFVEGCLLGTYSFRTYGRKKKDTSLDRVTILAKPSRDLAEKVRWNRHVAHAVHFARDLINTPANHMTPSHLAEAALSLRDRSLTVTILGRREAEKLGMGAYLSVAKGSRQPPRFIVLHYRGSKDRPCVLIGKSITFDSGGISLKPADGLEKMKYDMAGGAAVLGVLKAASSLAMPVHLIGILPAAENLPGGSASRPGDVVRAMNGTYIEIISTDAEGRMTLADGISYAAKFKPRAIVDIATLTGACAIAFGNCAVAMMGNDRTLLDAVKAAGEITGERVWEMPLCEEAKEVLKSDVADLKNSGGRGGSLVSSAFFLSEFAGKIPWVHLDIAGTAWADKDFPYIPKGATGVGVRLLTTLLRDLR